MTSLEMNDSAVARRTDPNLKGSQILILTEGTSHWPSILQNAGANIAQIYLGMFNRDFINKNEVDLVVVVSENPSHLALECVLAIQKTGQTLPIIALLEHEYPPLLRLIPCVPRQGKTDLVLADISELLGHSTEITSMSRLNEIYRGNETIVQSALGVIKSNLESEIGNYLQAVLSRSVSEIMYAAHRVRPIASLLGVTTLDAELRHIEENAISLNSSDLNAVSLNSIRRLRRVQREVNRLNP
ncbi:MAG: hypothetical protein GC193_00920 [Cryomorphaceae bacterium]|nr:hypothetical protein [Cryomorphaceae bacterium]